jgi:hypothetical protein
MFYEKIGGIWDYSDSTGRVKSKYIVSNAKKVNSI